MKNSFSSLLFAIAVMLTVNKSGDKVLIPVSSIQQIKTATLVGLFDNKDVTQVVFNSGESIGVKESLEEIYNMINN